MIPQIESDIINQEYYVQPNLTYRLSEKNISGKIDDLESIQQSIFHMLSTERYSNPIYDDDYGIELEQYIGKDISYIQADIETTLNEALTQDDRIISVQVDSVEQVESDFCLVKFTVYTKSGEIQEEINVIQ